MTHVRVGTDSDLIRDVVLAVDQGYSIPLTEANRDALRYAIRITVNGAVEGISLSPAKHVECLRFAVPQPAAARDAEV
jgi:hypothetical protein